MLLDAHPGSGVGAGLAGEDAWSCCRSGRRSEPRNRRCKRSSGTYDAKQLDLDEGATVKGRRHYTPQELKAITAIERQMRKDDQAPLKRKKIRRRRRRDNDDDD
jgi:hypothetical protein